MSCSHHQSPEEAEARSRLLDQFLNKSVPTFPGGRITKNDEGELAFAVALDASKKVIILRFGKPVDWLGLGSKEARSLGELLVEKANQCDRLPT